MAHAKVFRENGLVLRNRIKVLSLPFYNSGQEHPTTAETLEENFLLIVLGQVVQALRKLMM